MARLLYMRELDVDPFVLPLESVVLPKPRLQRRVLDVWSRVDVVMGMVDALASSQRVSREGQDEIASRVER